MYKFEHGDWKFSEGGLDELLVLDRYSTPETDIHKWAVGDKVVFQHPAEKLPKIGFLREIKKDILKVVVEDYEGIFHFVSHEDVVKPLDLEPKDLWERWSMAAASMEKIEVRRQWEDNFRWLFDGYRYSPGGRIQLMLGQEFTSAGKKANLSAYNCAVQKYPKIRPREDWSYALNRGGAAYIWDKILDVATEEIDIMRRGSGDGINCSTIPPNIYSPKVNKEDVCFFLSENHKDYKELQEMILISKFSHVLINETRKAGVLYTHIEVPDDIKGIMNSLRDMVRYIYSGEKVALSFNTLRHRGAYVSGVNGRSSGAASWMYLFSVVASILSQDTIDAVDIMEIFTNITLLVIQGGSRRGALLLMLNDNHPNIEKFITQKRTKGKLVGANISVGLSNYFMENKRIPNTREFYLWDKIVESAWASAEPGIIFLDRYNRMANSYYYDEVVCTNPCGL